MIYLIGGAPRTGKSILGQQIAAKRNVGWISTDLLMELLRVKNVEGAKVEWDATPEAIAAAAEWFFPCLARFDRFPGRSPDYARLPEEVRQQFAQDIPLWSAYVRQETERFGYPYVDMSDDFDARLRQAEAVLTRPPA